MKLFCAIFWLALLTRLATADGTESQAQSDDAVNGESRGPLSAGFAAGQLYENFYLTPLYEPWALKMPPSFIFIGDGEYRVHQFSTLPLQFEGEVTVAKRFGQAHESEVTFAPYLRWTSFPWNDVLYTNLRVSQFGLSYASGISAWERQNSGNDHGSRFLQSAGAELEFARSPQARVESYVGLHHRSGIYGLINGVSGASNYLIIGIRVFE